MKDIYGISTFKYGAITQAYSLQNVHVILPRALPWAFINQAVGLIETKLLLSHDRPGLALSKWWRKLHLQFAEVD